MIIIHKPETGKNYFLLNPVEVFSKDKSIKATLWLESAYCKNVENDATTFEWTTKDGRKWLEFRYHK